MACSLCRLLRPRHCLDVCADGGNDTAEFADLTLDCNAGGGKVAAKVTRSSLLAMPIDRRATFWLPERRAGPQGTSQRQTRTGMLVWVRTLLVVLPSRIAESPPRPCDAMTMTSQPLSTAVAMIALYGWSCSICKVSQVTPAALAAAATWLNTAAACLLICSACSAKPSVGMRICRYMALLLFPSKQCERSRLYSRRCAFRARPAIRFHAPTS